MNWLIWEKMFTYFYNKFRPVNRMHYIKYGANKLHGYTVHQQYPTLYFPTNAHNVKKHRVIKTF